MTKKLRARSLALMLAPAMMLGTVSAVWVSQAGATGDHRVAPPVPQIVRADGTLDANVLKGIGADPTTFQPPRLTPDQLKALTPQQRGAAHIDSTDQP